MSKRIVIVSDIQLPYHDRKAVKAVLKYIGDSQPDEVVFIGDVLDFPQPSRWNKDSRGEFEGSIYADVEMAKKALFGPLRDVYSGRVLFHEGNHDERPRVYLDKYSPALSGTKAFHVDTLCDFDGFGIELAPEFYDIAPGWVSTHGHRGGIKLNRVAGQTALNAAREFQKSVVMGHTHRLGIIKHTYGYGGDKKNEKIVTGMEVGNLMDMKLAGYLKGGTANWQQGFGLLTVDGQHVKAEVVPIEQKKFVVDGEMWAVT
ncbi:metallophosphoesterase [Nocardia rhizosphaerihabitans]|uniref:metallophosphoesterase n=1 Tax=Nocardia rhizosphaerihabitans TaxID=1691570 RepID=UPI00366C86D4